MIKTTLLWIISKWREIAVITLAIIIAIQTKRLNKANDNNATSQSVVDQQAKDIKMLRDELAHISVVGGHVIYLTRTVAGGALTGHGTPYKPPEGSTDISVTQTTTGGPPRIVVKVQTKGFTFRLGLGVLYSSKLYPELDVKWAFWDRYSIKTGVTLEFVDAGISRHVDDLIPFLNVQNLEIQGVYGKSFKWENRLGIGLRSNF